LAALLHPLLFLLVLLLLAPPASAGAKLDLTEYLAPASVVGDFKTVAVDNGDERRVETVEVQFLPQGRFEVTEFQLNGEIIGATAGIVIPGRKLVSTGLVSGAVLIRWKPPGVRRPLRVAPGRLVKTRGAGRAEVNGVKIGTASIRASALLVGFEETSSIRLKDRVMGRLIEVEADATAWYAPGLGIVATRERMRTFVDGVLEEDTGDQEMYVVEGTIGGLPFP
jgi:hypothetical protein